MPFFSCHYHSDLLIHSSAETHLYRRATARSHVCCGNGAVAAFYNVLILMATDGCNLTPLLFMLALSLELRA